MTELSSCVSSAFACRTAQPPWHLALALFLWPATAQLAHAQDTAAAIEPSSRTQNAADGPFAVVVANTQGAPVTDPAALSASLRRAVEHAGPGVLGDAAERFAQYHSKPAADLPTDVMDSLRKQIDQVTRDLAMGDLPSAVAGMEEIEGLQHQALVQLNRESEQARRLFTACVAMGVMLHDSGKDDEALTRLQHCAATFPGYRLSADAFSPQAISLYQSAVASIDPVILRVDNGSPELACTVRFNGLNVGTAPAELRVQRGWAGVQLECGDRPGRMHVIMLSQPKQHLVIDPVMEYALHAEGAALWLRYDDEATLARRAEEHALSITTALRVPRGLLARSQPAGGYRLSLLDADAPRTLAEVSWDGVEGNLQDAVNRLLHANTAGTPTPTAVAEQTPFEPRPEARTLVGLPLAWAWAWPVIGVAYGGSVGLSLYLLGQRGNDRVFATYLSTTTTLEQAYVDSQFAELVTVYDNRSMLSLFAGGVSNALFVAGSVLALPQHDGFMPYWAYISGGLGVALAGTGVALLATSRGCSLAEGCAYSQNWDRDPLLPTLLLIHAVGPLSVPVAYLIEKAVGARHGSVQFQANATARSAYFGLQGSF